MVIVYFHLVNGRAGRGTGQVTRVLSHPDDDPVTATARPPGGPESRSELKPAPFSFVRPQGLQHALEALAADPGAKVLAGGQSLVPLLNMRLAAPSTLVDINGLPDLDHVRADPDGVRVGALARHADVLASPDVRRVQPLLPLALAHVAHATIRNRGTVVGSLVHADAAAELPAVLALLGGTGHRGVDAGHPRDRGRRPVRRAAGVDGAARRDRGGGVLPGPRAGGRASRFDEIARRHGDYALCGVAAVVRVAGDAVVSARVGYLSVCRRPDRRRPHRRCWPTA